MVGFNAIPDAWMHVWLVHKPAQAACNEQLLFWQVTHGITHEGLDAPIPCEANGKWPGQTLDIVFGFPDWNIICRQD